METRQTLILSCVLISVIASSVGIEMKAEQCMKNQMPFIIACDIGLITQDVFFYKREEMIVECAKPGQPCGKTTTGCCISRDNTTAFLIIGSVDCINDSGEWYCKHGNEASRKITMKCSHCDPCEGFAMGTMIVSCILMVWNIISMIIMRSTNKCLDQKPFKYICCFMEMLSVIVGLGGCTGMAMFCESSAFDKDEAMMSAGMTMDIMSAVLGIVMIIYKYHIRTNQQTAKSSKHRRKEDSNTASSPLVPSKC